MRNRWISVALFVVLTMAILGLGSAAAFALPGNDSFASATPIAGASSSIAGDSRGATIQTPAGEIVYASETASIWYKWTAPPVDDIVSFDTVGSYDPLVGVSEPIATSVRAYGPYGAGVPAINTLAAVPETTYLSDTIPAGHIAFPFTAGQTYYVSITSPPMAVQGITALNWHTSGNTGHITGNVTATNGGTVLSGIRVDAYALGGNGNSLRTVHTNGSGGYDLTGLGTGSYQVRFTDDSVFHTYLTEWYDNKLTQSASTPIAVTNGAPTSIQNAVLDRASSISGTVRINGVATPNVAVLLLPFTGGVLDSGGAVQTLTNASGAYSFAELYPKAGVGNYYQIQYIEPSASGLTSFFYNQKSSLLLADKLQPTEGTPLTGKDGAWWTDFVAPTTTMGVTPSTPAYVDWKKGPVSLAFSAVDSGVSGVAKTLVSIDGTGPVEFTPAGGTIGISKDGTTQVKFWSLDNAGNSEATQTVTFKADSHAPTTSSNAAANYPAPATDSTITLSPIDAFSGVKTTHWSLVNSVGVNFGSGVTLTVPVPKLKGSYTLTFDSTDNVGNAETAKTAKFTVGTGDQTPPDVTPLVSPSTWTSATVVSVTLTAVEASSPPAVVQSKAPGEATWTTRVSGTPFDVSVGGILQYQAWDSQANTMTGEVNIKIDRIRPVTTPGAAPSYLQSSGAVITLAPTDADSGVVSTSWRILNPGAPIAQGSGTSVPVPAELGSYVLEYASTDLAGNVELTNQVAFAVIPLYVAPTPTSFSGLSVSSRPKHGKNVTFRATLSPGQALYAGNTRISFYRYETKTVRKKVRGRWKKVKVKYWRLRSAKNLGSNLVTTYKPGYAGSWKMQLDYSGAAGSPGVAGYSPTSAAKSFTVK